MVQLSVSVLRFNPPIASHHLSKRQPKHGPTLRNAAGLADSVRALPFLTQKHDSHLPVESPVVLPFVSGLHRASSG